MNAEHMDDGSGGFAGGMGGIQTMGILQALRTGDPRLDMVLAMCLPFLIRFLFDLASRFQEIFTYGYWAKFWSKEPHMHHRSISYRTTRSSYGGVRNLDEDSQNKVLQKAIQLYLHMNVDLKLQDANTNLTTIEGTLYDDGYDSDDEDRTIVGRLRKYKIVKNPPQGLWHDLGSYGDDEKKSHAAVLLRIEEVSESESNQASSGGTGSKTSSTLTFHLKSTYGRAIDAFIDTAYSWYLDELKTHEDHSRYLYELKSFGSATTAGSDDYGRDQGRVYKRFRLSDEKTFESLFFVQKESLLNLIRHFQERSGKYSIKGYPHKLGLLLHGPPGSGKTSLIKALAQYTNRSIINVPLSRISTNAELVSIFFDQNLYVEDEYVSTRLRFKDFIFVIEDVDAASKVVKRRDGKITAGKVQTDYVDLSLTKSPWRMLLESGDANCKELVALLMEKSERLSDEARRSDVVQTMAHRMLALPGLSIVGDSVDNPVLKRICDESVQSAESMMEKFGTVDRYIGTCAEKILRLLESGCEVNECLENELLGISPPGTLPPLAPLSQRTREVSFSKYDEDDEVHIEEPAPQYFIPASPLKPSAEASGTTTSNTATNNASGGAVLGPLLRKGLDELNLQGLLNVLDGVVDSPGRIVIMTTNHPEQLDPALIRPGRIDKKLYLGYMGALDMIKMLEHYFQVELSNDQRSRVEAIVSGIPSDSHSRLNLTPAQVEQLMAEYDDLEDMLVALEEKGQSLVPQQGQQRIAVDGSATKKSVLAYDV